MSPLGTAKKRGGYRILRGSDADEGNKKGAWEIVFGHIRNLSI